MKIKKSTWIVCGIILLLIGGGLLYRYVAQDVDSRGATRLMRALEENDITKTRQLLENGTDIHARDKSGQTALFYAARHTNDPLLLHKLVAAGADTLAKDKQGYTPLMTAAKYNTSPRILIALARYGRFLKEQTENKDKALAVAAQYNQADIIKTLLITGATPTDADGINTADLLTNNEQLSEQEKTDLRHVMLVLEILEARAKFRRENYPQPTEKRAESPRQAPVEKKPEPKPESETVLAEQKEFFITTPSEVPTSSESTVLVNIPATKEKTEAATPATAE